MQASAIRAWNAKDDLPPIAGKGWRILCGGTEYSNVIALDVDQGWIRVLCSDTRHDADGQPHMDPGTPGSVCQRLVSGKVELVPPGNPHP